MKLSRSQSISCIMQGDAQDKAEQAKRHGRAAEQGDAEAQYRFGNCYRDGIGVAQDYAEAVKWYRKASAQGVEHAHSNLGRCCQHILGEVSDFLASHLCPLGDARLLPFPKQTILYAIKWVTADCEAKRESATDEALSEKYSGVISTGNMLLTIVARDWHEIEPQDRDGVGRLHGSETFPDWALDLKRKYIDEERAQNDAAEATMQVMIDQGEFKKAKEKAKNPSLKNLVPSDTATTNQNVSHSDFVIGVQSGAMGIRCVAGNPSQFLRGARKNIFSTLVMLYSVAPLILIPLWAWHENNSWLLIGIGISFMTSFIATCFKTERANSFGAILLLAAIVFWFRFGIHSYCTFYALSALWGLVLFLMANNVEREYALQSLVQSSELFNKAVAQNKIMIVRKDSERTEN